MSGQIYFRVQTNGLPTYCLPDELSQRAKSVYADIQVLYSGSLTSTSRILEDINATASIYSAIPSKAKNLTSFVSQTELNA